MSQSSWNAPQRLSRKKQQWLLHYLNSEWIRMSWTDNEVLELLIGIFAGGRGGGVNPENPLLGTPSFGEALEEDRQRRIRGGSQPYQSRVSGRFPIPETGWPPKKKRKESAYNKRYGKCFKKLAPKYKKKNGGWKKDGFARCSKAARKCAKK